MYVIIMFHLLTDFEYNVGLKAEAHLSEQLLRSAYLENEVCAVLVVKLEAEVGLGGVRGLPQGNLGKVVQFYYFTHFADDATPSRLV